MPLIALLSDVHANYAAISAVFHHMQDHWHPTEVWNLGDVVGYNAHPVQVLESYWTRFNVSIKGNHDDALGKGTIPETFNSYAAAALRWSFYKVPTLWRQALHGVPSMRTIERSEHRILLAHGGPSFPLDQYVYPESDLAECIELMKFTDLDAMFLGNTHIPFCHQEDNKIIANPGSVGQSRDGDPRACYAILDTDEWKIEFQRVSYDIEVECKAIRESQLPEENCARLNEGR